MTKVQDLGLKSQFYRFRVEDHLTRQLIMWTKKQTWVLELNMNPKWDKMTEKANVILQAALKKFKI